jgi:hypothetical protein
MELFCSSWAERLYGRFKVREELSLEEFERQME